MKSRIIPLLACLLTIATIFAMEEGCGLCAIPLKKRSAWNIIAHEDTNTRERHSFCAACLIQRMQEKKDYGCPSCNAELTCGLLWATYWANLLQEKAQSDREPFVILKQENPALDAIVTALINHSVECLDFMQEKISSLIDKNQQLERLNKKLKSKKPKKIRLSQHKRIVKIKE